MLLAVGRVPEVAGMGLDKLGVRLEPGSKKILTDVEDRTSVPHIFAIGDIAYGRLELTPTAIMVIHFQSHKNNLKNYIRLVNS